MSAAKELPSAEGEFNRSFITYPVTLLYRLIHFKLLPTVYNL